MTQKTMKGPIATKEVVVTAPAKINLNLLVGPLREDGYHPLDSIVTKISLCDNITLSLAGPGQISCQCVGDIDCGPQEKNLAYLAAKALLEFAPDKGVDIRIEKNIPAGGGLGGGSSNAAAVIKGLNQLWKLDLSDEKMLEIAASLGSDVPLFLIDGPVRMTGRGEILDRVGVRHLKIVLILPKLSCPTGEVYQAYDNAPRVLEGQLPLTLFSHPVEDWVKLLDNHLTEPAFAVEPKLQGIWDSIKVATGKQASLSGSGSTMFIICDDTEDPAKLAELISDELSIRCEVVESI